MGQEKERLGKEDVPMPRDDVPDAQEKPKGKPGRPPMDDTERNSDPSKAVTGKQPKPSNPEGSLD